MATAELKAVCSSVDMDAVTHQCTAVQWVPNGVDSFFPPLSAGEGAALSGAIGACWAVGFLVRLLRQTARG